MGPLTLGKAADWKSDLKTKYGMTPAEYAELLKEQNGVCAICKNRNSYTGIRRLCVDHDKQSKVIRGLLCHSCNIGLGHFKHSLEHLKAAIMYLTPETK